MDRPTILRAGYLWDGVSSKVIADGAILVAGERIVAVGPAREILNGPHEQAIEWPGATLLPGLIDSHTHLSMDASMDDYLDHMSDDVDVLTLRATTMMHRDLMAGVTTCRCLGDRGFLDVACRHATEKREVAGPRLLVATRGIRAPQGHGFVGYPFEGTEEIRRAIRENIDRGADLTKIYITGTLKGNGNLPAYLSKEEIRLAIEESHAAGVRVAAHCVGGPGLDWALELGLDTLEHAYHITPGQTEELTKSATALVLTPGAVLSEQRVRRLPGELIEGHLRERERMFDSMALTVNAGIPFAVGTDGLHGALSEDIAFLRELGATPVEALKAATINGAKVCGIERKTGSLQAGKIADILAVEGNPLDDLRALHNITAVISKGRWIRAAGMEVKPENHAYNS